MKLVMIFCALTLMTSIPVWAEKVYVEISTKNEFRPIFSEIFDVDFKKLTDENIKNKTIWHKEIMLDGHEIAFGAWTQDKLVKFDTEQSKPISTNVRDYQTISISLNESKGKQHEWAEFIYDSNTVIYAELKSNSLLRSNFKITMMPVLE